LSEQVDSLPERQKETLDGKSALTQSILDAMPDLMFQIRKDGTFLSYKGGVDELYAPPEQFLGKKIHEVLPKNLADLTMRNMKAALGNGGTQTYEYELPISDETRYFESRMVKSGTDEVVAVVRDITERKRNEREIQSSEERLKVIFEHAPDGYFVSDFKGYFTDGNKATEEICGFKREDIIGTNILRNCPIVPIDQVPLVAKILAQNIKGKSTGPDELEIVRKDGKRHMVEVKTLVMEIKGEPRVLGIVRDIHERKVAEAQVREYQEQLTSIFQTVRDGLALIDLSGAILRVNKAFATISAYKEDELVGKQIHKLEMFSKAGRAQLMTGYAKMRLGRRTPAFELEASRKGGERFHLEVSADPIKKEGVVVGMAVSLKDITDRKSLEGELREHAKNLEDDVRARTNEMIQSEKMASIGLLVAGVAHEVNNPLAFIKSNSEDMQEDIENVLEKVSKKGDVDTELLDEVDALIETNLKGIDRIAEITKTLKRFARPETTEMVPSDINQGIQDTLVMVHNKIKYRVEVLGDYGEVPAVMGHIGQLNQVFMNIILNASQAMDKGNVWVRTWHKDGNVMVEIRDDGKGIPEKDLGRIFDPFFTTKEGGTGLGLSACYRIVQEHNGSIDVRSTVGKGTAFTITLPVGGRNG
jgi:PAS domain S-box-containing protein